MAGVSFLDKTGVTYLWQKMKDHVSTALKSYQTKLAFDSTPTADSSNPVTSAGVKAALDRKANASSLGTKQDRLTFDSAPTANSANPVTSAGIKGALDGKANTSITLSGYGITDAYTKTEMDTQMKGKQSKATISSSAPESTDGNDGDLWFVYDQVV